jgi:hypothetical protein
LRAIPGLEKSNHIKPISHREARHEETVHAS